MSISIRARVVVCLAIMGTLPSMADPVVSSNNGDICAEVSESFEALEARIMATQSQLKALEQQLATRAILDAKRAELADLVFKQDCVRPDAQPDPVRGPAAKPEWVTLTTYYATNRLPGPAAGAIATYSGQRDPAGIRYGRVTVSIPTDREKGDLNLPLNLWLFELPADPSRHFIIKSVSPLAPGVALNQMRTRIGQLPNKSVLLFVHGYNVPFQDAALRTAQLAHDLNFPGLPMFFSWPSSGNTGGYAHDEEMSELSLNAFNTLLDRVGSLNASQVYIVAHSMGNRVVTRAIAQRIAKGRPVPSNLKGLLLAAPDINADIFREQIAPGLATLSGTAKTIYASNNDAALRASRLVHDFPRVGLTRPSVQTFSGWETVDATAAAPVRRSWGHSYVVDSPKVIRDMQVLIFQNRGAQQRGLTRLGTPPAIHWAIK